MRQITKNVFILSVVVLAINMAMCFAYANEDEAIFLQNEKINILGLSTKDLDLLEKKYRDISIDAYMQGKVFSLSFEEFMILEGNTISRINYEYYYVEENSILSTLDDNTDLGTGKWYYDTGYGCPSSASYSEYDLVGNIIRGDIFVEEDSATHGYLDHSGIVEGTFYDASNHIYYIRVVESISNGVRRGVVDDTRVDDKGCRFYRLKNYNEDAADSAASFAVTQIGEPWVFHAYYEYLASHYGWYCSELVWASYMNQNINIVPNPSDPYYILPYDIDNSSRLCAVAI